MPLEGDGNPNDVCGNPVKMHFIPYNIKLRGGYFMRPTEKCNFQVVKFLTFYQILSQN